MKKIILSSFLEKLKNYLGEKPEHNQVTNTLYWLTSLASTVSLKEQAEAGQLKNFLDEIKTVIQKKSETDFTIEVTNRIEILLDIVLQESSHAEDLLRARRTGKFAEELKRINQCLDHEISEITISK